MMDSVTTHAPEIKRKRSLQPRLWHLVSWLAFEAIAVCFAFLASAHWPYRYRIIKPMLEEVLGGQVTIAHYHRTYFPNPGFMATGVTLDRNPTPAFPPLGTINSISVQGSWLDLILLRERVRRVDLTGLRLVIPAAGTGASKKDFPPGSSSSFGGPDTLIDQLAIHDSALDVVRAQGGLYTFPIHLLTIGNLQKGRKLWYSVDMDNARPRGHIVSSGSFGPLNPGDLGATPLSGHFTFEQVNLHDIGNISGTLSSEGSFQGNLAHIHGAASTFTPDFAVDGGTPTPVTTSAHYTISGLSGDVLLDEIDAEFVSTVIHLQGRVAGSPKVIDVDISVPAGRAQDVLRPFLHSASPIEGTVWLKSHAHVDPAGDGVPFLDRLHVEGTFDVPTERLTDHKVEQALSAFSKRAQKEQPSKAEPSVDTARSTNSNIADVVSSLKGNAKIERGIVTTPHLEFQIPGSSVDLKGAFNLHNRVVDLAGNLRIQNDVSHATTGFKSILLKPLIPFFKKRKAGAVVPVAVTGEPGSYKVSQNLLGNK